MIIPVCQKTLTPTTSNNILLEIIFYYKRKDYNGFSLIFEFY